MKTLRKGKIKNKMNLWLHLYVDTFTTIVALTEINAQIIYYKYL